MPLFQDVRRVKHSASQMFVLVADVEQYPTFLPLCEQLTVQSRTTDSDGIEVLIANMSVGYKAIHERFASRVTLNQTGLTILVEYVDGPFKFLENRWTFQDVEGGSTIDFFIRYEFKSRMLGFLMGAMFERAFTKFSAAFEKRADAVYGRS